MSNPLKIYKPNSTDFKLKMMIFGPAGVGKTTLAASAQAVPEMAEVLYMNIEGGTLALHDPSVYGAKTIPDTWDFTKFEDIEPLLRFLASGKHKYKTLVVDSLGELCSFGLDHIVDKKMNNGGKNQSIDDVHLDDYGTLTKKMRRLIRFMRDMPMHVIFVTHDMPANSEPNAMLTVNITPKLRKSVVANVDIMAFMRLTYVEKEGGKGEKVLARQLITTPSRQLDCKDRSPGSKLAGVMVNPTMARIMKAILSSSQPKMIVPE